MSKSFDIAGEMRAFCAMLDDPKFQANLNKMLPDTIKVQTFVRTAKTAAQNNPKLLDPEWRESLMRSIAKAAAQGLLPDGKHGALIPRPDNSAGGKYQVCWQPMIWGITQLGRRAGAIQKMSAHIVFKGEEYEVLGGEDDVIKHRIDPEIVDAAYQPNLSTAAFLDKIVLAYCIITAPNGSLTKRWMTKSRIMRVWQTSKAAAGPWAGPFRDEMVLKTVILFTSKWIDLDGDTPEMARFRDAMETDMEADFALIDGGKSQVDGVDRRALPAPSPNLSNLEAQLNVGNSPTLDRLVDRANSTTSVQPPLQQPETPDESKHQHQKQQQQQGVSEAHKRVSEFVEEMKDGLVRAENEDGVSALIGIPNNLTKINRIKKGYPTFYKAFIGFCSSEDMIGKMGLLETSVGWLYEDIMDARLNPANSDSENEKAA